MGNATNEISEQDHLRGSRGTRCERADMDDSMTGLVKFRLIDLLTDEEAVTVRQLNGEGGDIKVPVSSIITTDQPDDIGQLVTVNGHVIGTLLYDRAGWAVVIQLDGVPLVTRSRNLDRPTDLRD